MTSTENSRLQALHRGQLSVIPGIDFHWMKQIHACDLPTRPAQSFREEDMARRTSACIGSAALWGCEGADAPIKVGKFFTWSGLKFTAPEGGFRCRSAMSVSHITVTVLVLVMLGDRAPEVPRAAIIRRRKVAACRQSKHYGGLSGFNIVSSYWPTTTGRL